ncbi:hypothetical protein ABEB36_015532 [Hypothenemus hampei]|uniref:Uncharacterized protein n=1 Tax=Hypothenemus hampei TaxID=57062 RepID=A0ABD1DZF7_HYPHA
MANINRELIVPSPNAAEQQFCTDCILARSSDPAVTQHKRADNMAPGCQRGTPNLRQTATVHHSTHADPTWTYSLLLLSRKLNLFVGPQRSPQPHQGTSRAAGGSPGKYKNASRWGTTQDRPSRRVPEGTRYQNRSEKHNPTMWSFGYPTHPLKEARDGGYVTLTHKQNKKGQTHGALLVWKLTLSLSDMGDPTGCDYATVGIA